MNEWNMMVVFHPDTRGGMTAPAMTRLSSLSETLLVNLIFSLDCAFSLICKRQDHIVLISGQSTWFGVWTVYLSRMTLAHAQTHYDFLQYSE